MNKHNHFLVLFLVCCFCQTAFSQSTNLDVNEIESTKKLQAKLYAINTVDEYSSLVRLSSDYSTKKFPKKFSSNASHVNDILWRNSSMFQTLSFQEYFTVLQTFCRENTLISSFDVNCNITDVNLIESRTEFSSDTKHSISTVVIVDVIKNIQFKDVNYDLLFSGEIPLTFEVNIFEDKYGRLRSEISSAVTQDSFIPFDFSILDLGTGYALKDMCDLKDYGIEIEDRNEEYILFKYEDPTSQIILEDIDKKRDDEDPVISDRNKDNVLKIDSQELRSFSVFASIDWAVPGQGNIDFTSSESFSNPINNTIEASGLVFLNDINPGDKRKYQQWKRQFDFLVGLSYLSQRSELRLDGYYQTSPQFDSDNFAYSRLSTYTDVKETFNIEAFSVTFGLQLPGLNLPGLNKETLRIRGFHSFSFNTNVDYANRCVSSHAGYYEDLYGIIIDENLYDYGVYQSYGTGSLNSLSRVSDWGVTLDLKPKAFAIPLGQRYQLNPSLRVSWVSRSFSFENNSDELLEVDPETLNSTTMLIDDMNFNFLKIGISGEISRIPTPINDCP
ncbi:MAG: hypothetical protein CL847_05630 [Crocinitomicaceae bacterium]|nr:hypothetical protein [Crocinitomicaceae bacterium]|tara:strand:+ start:10961 stop:12634 length:1674 start_codon:yes stop_codon:yes gene_type:complete